MGILRSREELIPVTCAVLNDSDRRDFFNKVRKKAGKVERIAQLCGVSASTVSDWMSGQCLIPYHALQRMAVEFGVEAPQVSELRREMQAVSEVRPPARPHPAPAPKPAKAEKRPPKAKAPRGGRQPQRQASSHKPPAPRRNAPKERPKKAHPQPQKKAAPAPKGKPGEVKYSEQLAYWTGVTFAAARCEGEELRLSADRRMGQNFAGTWARQTETLFGVKPVLSMTEDHRAQIAALPLNAAGDFIAKLGLKPGSGPAEAPPAPRWVWSNPTWKAAFLKGVVDAASHFHRTPAVKLIGLSENLRKSVHKILASLAFAPKLLPDGTVSIEGGQDVEKYFESVGTENFKLRDQFSAYKKSRSGGRPQDLGGGTSSRHRSGGRPQDLGGGTSSRHRSVGRPQDLGGGTSSRHRSVGRPRRRHPGHAEAAPVEQAPSAVEPAPALVPKQEGAAPHELPADPEAPAQPEQIDLPLPDAGAATDDTD